MGVTGDGDKDKGTVPRQRISWAGALLLAVPTLAIGVGVFHFVGQEVQQNARVRAVQRYSELIDAVKEGDVQTVTDLLDQGVPMTQEPFASILSFAATQADPDMVRALVDLGADVTQRDRGGNTPLAYADQAGRAEVTEFLAQALAEASPPGGPIRRLWEMGIPFTARAFFAAAGENDIDTVTLFLDAEMNVDSEGVRGETALLAAARNGNQEVVRLLLEHGAGMPDARRALKKAAGLGHYAVVVALIEGGVDPNGQEKNWSVLMHALKRPRVRQFLVDSGADVNHPQDEMDHTALHIAISPRLTSTLSGATRQERRDWVRFFIDSGADVNKRSDDDLRPLDLARIEGDAVIVQWLIEAGAVGREP